MNTEQSNALKAGIKTAVITFITALVALAVKVLDALQSAVIEGNPPDLSFVAGLGLAAASALAVGVINALIRFTQASGVPLLASLFDRLVGQIPRYLPPENAIDRIQPDRDRGESTVVVVAAIVVIVIGIVWLARNL